MEQYGKLMLTNQHDISPTNGQSKTVVRAGGQQEGNIDWTNECVFECKLCQPGRMFNSKVRTWGSQGLKGSNQSNQSLLTSSSSLMLRFVLLGLNEKNQKTRRACSHDKVVYTRVPILILLEVLKIKK